MSMDRVLTQEKAIIAGASSGLWTPIVETKSDAGAHDPGIGARLVVYLSSDGATEITEKLISSIWDPWNNLRKASDDHRP